MKRLILNRAQVPMYDFMVRRPGAFICAEPGLGKTAATLAYIKHLIETGKDTGALIIAPLNVALLSWPNEVAEWAEFSGLRVSQLREGLDDWRHGRSHIYIINYEQLPKLAGTIPPCQTVVFDESWRAKNPSSKLIHGFRRDLISKFRRRVALNGTPRPNKLQELFAQVRLLDGGKRLGAKFSHHLKEFYNETRRPGMIRPIITPKPGAVEEVYRRIADLTLVLRQEDYLDLTPMEVIDIWVTLPPEARRVYDEMEADFITQVTRNSQHILAFDKASAMNKLRQITSGAVYDQFRVVHHLHSAKIDALQELRGAGNLLVLTDFLHERDRVVQAGATLFSREAAAAWNRGEVPMLAAHCISAGVGLNLQAGGNIAVWLTVPYSPLAYFQANSRLHRTGQTKPVTVYRIVAKDTIDEAVLETQRRKSAAQAAMMQSPIFSPDAHLQAFGEDQDAMDTTIQALLALRHRGAASGISRTPTEPELG